MFTVSKVTFTVLILLLYKKTISSKEVRRTPDKKTDHVTKSRGL